MSQFQTLQFSMTLDRWRRERERDQLYAGADGGLRPLPLGRGSAWRPPTTSYWVVMWENARPCAGRGVGWAVAWGGRGGEVGEPEGAEGAHLGGVGPPSLRPRRRAQKHHGRFLPIYAWVSPGNAGHGAFLFAPSRAWWGLHPSLI